MFIPLPEQIWGVALFILGNAILTFASKLELHEIRVRKDRRRGTAMRLGENRGIDSNPLRKTKLWMSALGFGLGAFGIFLFFRSFY